MCVVPCGGRKAIRIKVNQEQGDLKNDRSKGGREKEALQQRDSNIFAYAYWLAYVTCKAQKLDKQHRIYLIGKPDRR